MELVGPIGVCRVPAFGWKVDIETASAARDFYARAPWPHGEPWSPPACALGRSSWSHSERPCLFPLLYNQPISSYSEVENLQRLLSNIKKKAAL